MSITMQGSWTVSVKSKSAGSPQRFVISGADSGNGIYKGEEQIPPISVLVTGSAWSITIQNNPGSGFIDSDDQIKFPTISGGQHHFDIESNDAWEGDQDFNDLILTCSMPQTATDFLVYGNVTTYQRGCCFNPCLRRWVVIETIPALLEALKNPLLRRPIEELYPERLEVELPEPGPMPDPPPFRPLVIPLHGNTALPPKKAQVLKVSELATKRLAKSKTRAKGYQEMSSFATYARSINLSQPRALAFDYNRVALGHLMDMCILNCRTKSLPGVVLKLQEYDRTNAEMAGGAYTGEGNREDLGVCVTDRNGNYIFRFTRSIAQFLEEADIDTALGEDSLVQAQPDIIVQLLDPMATTGVAYESAPYWNVPIRKRINICIPDSYLGQLPTACQGHDAIQAIGNIFIGEKQPDGTRVGFNNFLGVEGRITARNTLPGTPQARCAAWRGNLDLYACFIDLAPEVTRYTIRYRRKLPGGSWTPWSFFQQEYRHPLIANVGLDNYNGDLVGSEDYDLHIDGGPLSPAKTYKNIEIDTAWVLTHRARKAVISSWLYAPVPGPVEFLIEGYNDATRQKVPGAEDNIILYIDNSRPDFSIPSVTMLGAAGGDCALFVLPEGQLNAPLTVTFKADQKQGFLNAYQLSVRKGNTLTFVIQKTAASPGEIQGQYAHGDDLLCNQFRGTFDDPVADVSGFVTVDIEPAAGNWLAADQPFCTFAVQLSCSTRVTNGYNQAVYSYGHKQYLLGIQT